MQRYYIIDREIEAGEPGFDAMIAQAYAQKIPVHCLCRRDVDLPLYIARRHDQHVLARWPGSGATHAPACDHYEAPDFLTGLGQVRGSAIKDDDKSGETTLMLGFPLSRGAARAAPASLTNDKADVSATPQRLTMRGLLHFLWDRAELTHWHPRMAGKRNWYIVRRQLLHAAHGCKARGHSLGDVVFVPETFRLDAKDAIAGRRSGELHLAKASKDAIMVLVGEIRAIEPARYGEKILIRHLPDWPFLVDADMARRFHKRFAVEEELWRSDEQDGHLMIAASFSISPSGLPQLIETALMPVTREWLPYEGLEERNLIARAVEERRRFVKGLRYNLVSDKPIASLALTDTGAQATAVHLARHLPDPSYDEALAALMRTPGVAHVAWCIGDALPSPGMRPPPAPTTASTASATSDKPRLH